MSSLSSLLLLISSESVVTVHRLSWMPHRLISRNQRWINTSTTSSLKQNHRSFTIRFHLKIICQWSFYLHVVRIIRTHSQLLKHNSFHLIDTFRLHNFSLLCLCFSIRTKLNFPHNLYLKSLLSIFFFLFLLFNQKFIFLIPNRLLIQLFFNFYSLLDSTCCFVFEKGRIFATQICYLFNAR